MFYSVNTILFKCDITFLPPCITLIVMIRKKQYTDFPKILLLCFCKNCHIKMCTDFIIYKLELQNSQKNLSDDIQKI